MTMSTKALLQRKSFSYFESILIVVVELLMTNSSNHPCCSLECNERDRICTHHLVLIIQMYVQSKDKTVSFLSLSLVRTEHLIENIRKKRKHNIHSHDQTGTPCLPVNVSTRIPCSCNCLQISNPPINCPLT